MSLQATLQEQNGENIQRLFEHVGGYSLGKQLLIASVAAILLVLGRLLIGFVRGTSRPLTRSAQRDVLIGIACLLPVITFLGFFFFVARGYWTVLRGPSK